MNMRPPRAADHPRTSASQTVRATSHAASFCSCISRSLIWIGIQLVSLSLEEVKFAALPKFHEGFLAGIHRRQTFRFNQQNSHHRAPYLRL